MKYYMMNYLILNLIQLILILMSIAFITLMERKILSYMQDRKGPNKVAMIGLIQPFSDAIKLFLKENILLKNLNYIMYMISPIMSILLMLIMWMNSPNFYILNSKLNILFMICLLSMNVYPMMIMGWSSNSMYSMLGSIRSIAQTISYEVSMILFMMMNLMLTESFNILDLHEHQSMPFTFYLPITSYLFFYSLIAELNRTPFDLAEGESELVSGFNTEYMSGSFALIFLAEYGMIIFMSNLWMMFFWMNDNNSTIWYQVKLLYTIFFIIWMRASFPRMRYDQMMMMIWKSFLPISLNMLIYFNFIKWLMIYL